jgi:threonine/homoserine/homoserine lactone efflux protein
MTVSARAKRIRTLVEMMLRREKIHAKRDNGLDHST